MGQVRLNINGRHYDIACDDGQEAHVSALGKALADQVEALATRTGQVGEARLLLMAALILADEAAQLRVSMASQKDEVARLAATAVGGANPEQTAQQILRLTQRIESLAARLEQA